MLMVSLTAVVLASLINLALAAYVYLSLHGWLVPYEPSGMQLIIHPLVTAPVILGTSAWLFFLSQAKKCSHSLWMVNILGLLIPAISLQNGITAHGYDKLGLLIIGFVALASLLLYGKELWQSARG